MSSLRASIICGKRAEEAGIADRLLVIVGSDFSRTPYYNSAQGKDHWSVGSYIIMEKGKRYTNRYVDGSDEGQNSVKIDPATLKAIYVWHETGYKPCAYCAA